MNEQEKAILGLGVYTSLADGEFEDEEVTFICQIARECLGGENMTTDEFGNTIGIFLKGFNEARAAEDQESGDRMVIDLLIKEAKKLPDEVSRLLALKFCILVATQDGEFEAEEGNVISVICAVWKNMNDGWDYSTEEAVDLVMAETG